MYNRKFKEVEIFGEKVYLYERNAGDVLAAIDLSKKVGFDSLDSIVYNSVIVIRDSINMNQLNLKWYDYFKKRTFRKKFSQRNLIKKLTTSQIMDFAQEIYVLDGLMQEGEKFADIAVDKKKVKEKV